MVSYGLYNLYPHASRKSLQSKASGIMQLDEIKEAVLALVDCYAHAAAQTVLSALPCQVCKPEACLNTDAML